LLEVEYMVRCTFVRIVRVLTQLDAKACAEYMH
jgi:hypothetical protein